MMKSFIWLMSLFSLLMASPLLANAQEDEELLHFDRPLIDVGTMEEDEGPSDFVFVGRNVSGKVLHISQVRTTCGCTKSDVKGAVLQPGDTCRITLTFTPNRFPGIINTGAFVYVREVEQPIVRLALRGEVLPREDSR